MPRPGGSSTNKGGDAKYYVPRGQLSFHEGIIQQYLEHAAGGYGSRTGDAILYADAAVKADKMQNSPDDGHEYG